jgi:transposase-like protein
MDTRHTEGEQQPPTCPRCHSTHMVRILYGLPSGEGFAMAERDEVVLGGCVIDASSPQWACKTCGESFGQRLTRDLWEALRGARDP